MKRIVYGEHLVKKDVVGRYLRKISRRLRKARAAGKGSLPSPSGGDDDTARERAESVARAISYCRALRRRGARPGRRPPSPSHDDSWLHDRQEEIIASAAACCDGSADSQTPPLRPRLDGGSLTARRGIECRVSLSQPPPPMKATGKQGARKRRSGARQAGITGSDVVHCKELPHHGHHAINSSAAASRRRGRTCNNVVVITGFLKYKKPGSFDEMEFLKMFNGGDEETIGHHFITVQI
uniref:Uncharacterized protein n=1 Tax=Setaria viridis TaxID=4556 RepID=A0A4U6STX2_SETVI|nr:hypothetical protein SEVIR_9G038900v2 [Setaria viridis]